MADYIDSSILCESYLYVSAYDLTPDKKARIQHFLASYAQTRAPLFFDTEVLVDVEVLEGSLKAKVTIAGSMAALIIFYGNLRTGIDYLFKDAQFIASGLVTESMFAAGVRRPDVTRVEVRTGLPGALKRVISRIDALSAASASMPHDEFSQQLAGIRAEVERILNTISAPEDTAAVANGLGDILGAQYPTPIPSPPGSPKSPIDEMPAPMARRQEIEAFLDKLKALSQAESA